MFMFIQFCIHDAQKIAKKNIHIVLWLSDKFFCPQCELIIHVIIIHLFIKHNYMYQ